MEEKKTSKWAIAIFIFAILGILSLLSGITYETIVMLIIGSTLSAAIIYFTYYLKKREIKKGFGGTKLINFAFYTLIILLVIDITSSIILSGYLNNLKNFTIKNTPNFFNNDFVGLKENSTENLKKVLSYEKEMENMKKQFAEIGNIKECEKTKENLNTITFGPYMNFEKINIGIRGNYAVRCYGENKAFDFYGTMKYENKKWLIDDYTLNADISKDFDLQSSKQTE